MWNVCARNLRDVDDGRLIICENDLAESVNLYARDANGPRVTRPFPFFETVMVFGVVFPGRYEEYDGTRVHTRSLGAFFRKDDYGDTTTALVVGNIRRKQRAKHIRTRRRRRLFLQQTFRQSHRRGEGRVMRLRVKRARRWEYCPLSDHYPLRDTTYRKRTFKRTVVVSDTWRRCMWNFQTLI